MARPSKMTAKMKSRIVFELAEGATLIQVCEPEDMPHRSTVLRAVLTDEDFAKEYRLARELGSECLNDKATECARFITDRDSAIAYGKKAEIYFRAAGRQCPRRFNEAVLVRHAGEIK